MSDASATVLVVDDEPQLVELYASWLEDEYEIRTATGGEDALGRLDEAVDVVLLDRRMPDLSGDEVLAEIRDRGMNCRVAMITAVKPDVDVIQMGFDEYLTKPVSRDEVRDTVEALLSRVDYDTQLQEYFALVSKRATLQATQDAESRDEYQEIETRLAELKQQVDGRLADFNDRDFKAVFSTLAPVDDAGPGSDNERSRSGRGEVQ